jgi:hypothetical protein
VLALPTATLAGLKALLTVGVVVVTTKH